MANIYADNSLSIGRTPLIKLIFASHRRRQSHRAREDRGEKPGVLSEVSHRGGNDLGRGKARRLETGH